MRLIRKIVREDFPHAESGEFFSARTSVRTPRVAGKRLFQKWEKRPDGSIRFPTT